MNFSDVWRELSGRYAMINERKKRSRSSANGVGTGFGFHAGSRANVWLIANHYITSHQQLIQEVMTISVTSG